MSDCIDQNFPCQNIKYEDFDNVAKNELKDPLLANELVNNSNFCTVIPIDNDFLLGNLKSKDFIRKLSGKTGIYKFWIDYDQCDTHNTRTMLCVYVGKGIAYNRVDDHITRKWKSYNVSTVYVTFNEFENRLSKYYEQLFLDTYKFHLNSNENSGSEHLFAVWDEELHLWGTEFFDVCDRLKVNNLDDI